MFVLSLSHYSTSMKVNFHVVYGTRGRQQKKMNFNAKQEGIWRAKKREITSTFGYGTLEGSGRKKLTWIHFEVYVVELHQLDPRKLTHDPPSTAPNQRIDQRSMPFLTEFHFFTLNFEIFTRNLPKMFLKLFFLLSQFFFFSSKHSGNSHGHI